MTPPPPPPPPPDGVVCVCIWSIDSMGILLSIFFLPNKTISVPPYTGVSGLLPLLTIICDDTAEFIHCVVNNTASSGSQD